MGVRRISRVKSRPTLTRSLTIKSEIIVSVDALTSSSSSSSLSNTSLVHGSMIFGCRTSKSGKPLRIVCSTETFSAFFKMVKIKRDMSSACSAEAAMNFIKQLIAAHWTNEGHSSAWTRIDFAKAVIALKGPLRAN